METNSAWAVTTVSLTTSQRSLDSVRINRTVLGALIDQSKIGLGTVHYIRNFLLSVEIFEHV